MSWYVRDAYAAKRPIPPDTTAPANGSPLFQAIVRNQVQSLYWLSVPLRFYWLSAFVGGKPGRRAVDHEWAKITGAIDARKLPIIGLIRKSSWNPFKLTSNHQVLAYAYDDDGTTRHLKLYDPNHPNDDTVVVTIDATGLKQSTGEDLLDLFNAVGHPRDQARIRSETPFPSIWGGPGNRGKSPQPREENPPLDVSPRPPGG